MSKIYISDLDGTLLRNDGTISEYTFKKLNFLLKNDVNFTVASARSFFSIKDILKGIQIKLPIIEFNGAFITNLNTGEHIIINEIRNDIVNDLLEIIKKNNNVPFISSYNRNKDHLYYHESLNEGMEWYLKNRIESNDPRLKKISTLEKIHNEKVVCFTVIDKRKNLENLVNEIEKKYLNELEFHFIENQYSPGWYWFTIHDKKATKDQAIKLLFESLNLNLENLIVFGDNLNDLKMFKIASKSIAVSNANEDLKKYASEITETNEDDSVVKYILKEQEIIK